MTLILVPESTTSLDGVWNEALPAVIDEFEAGGYTVDRDELLEAAAEHGWLQKFRVAPDPATLTESCRPPARVPRGRSWLQSFHRLPAESKWHTSRSSPGRRDPAPATTTRLVCGLASLRTSLTSSAPSGSTLFVGMSICLPTTCGVWPTSGPPRALVLALAYCGIRWGAAVALHVRDVEFLLSARSWQSRRIAHQLRRGLRLPVNDLK